MSYLTKEQLETYLQELPSPNKTKSNYDQIKSELDYPMQHMTVQDEEETSYETIQERMKRLRNATGTLVSSTQTQTPAFPSTPKPMVYGKPSIHTDAFESSLSPRTKATKRFPPATPPKLHTKAPTTPPLPPALHSPPAIPSSPRPPKPSPNDKVRTLNPIYAGLTCPGCDQAIEGSVVSAMDQIWHNHCFKCASCHQLLENQQYFEKEGQAYCGKDYRKLFSLHCDFCHEPIQNSAISALGKHYHEDHFCCTLCRQPLGDNAAFMVHEEKPYCQRDYLNICGKKCSGCGEYISGEYINALDGEWHKACFSCSDCKKPFTNGTFLVKNNKPYCEQHYHHPLQSQQPSQQQRPLQRTPSAPKQPPPVKPKPMIAKKPDLSTRDSATKRESVSVSTKKTCHQCRQEIDGPCANALGHDFHVHHFQCSACERSLSSRVPGMWQADANGELVCKMCAFKKGQQ